MQEQDLYDSVEPWRALRSVGSIGFQVSDTQLNSVLCADEGRELGLEIVDEDVGTEGDVGHGAAR